MIPSLLIRVAAVLTGSLLLAGCAVRLDPVPTEPMLSFGAESSRLLRDEETKASIKEGSNFEEGDAFSVFGMLNNDDGQTLIFGDSSEAQGTTVTLTSGSWGYSPLRSWQWSNSSDYYDFIAVYPAGCSERMDISGDLAVSTCFDLSSATPDNYDLMSATCRRKGNAQNPCGIVNLAFSHLTSAVQVVVVNKSGTTDVQVNAIAYKNLVVTGDAKSTMDLYGNDHPGWINLERSTATVRQTLYTEDIPAGNRYSFAYDFMIPQSLEQTARTGSDEADMPRLLLTFTPGGGSEQTADICLKDVTREDGSTITSWEMGVKYTYYISMRLDDGLLVTLVTTAWDSVEAETPGVLL